MWTALALRDKCSSCRSSLCSSRLCSKHNSSQQTSSISDVQTVITKSSVSPHLKLTLAHQTYTQNATKFTAILVCTAICLTIVSCCQDQWILSSFFIGPNDKVDRSTFCIILKEEKQLLMRYLRYLLFHCSPPKVTKSFPREIPASNTNFLPKQKKLKIEPL